MRDESKHESAVQTVIGRPAAYPSAVGPTEIDTRAHGHCKPPIAQRELVVMAAFLMALHALSIDTMLPALDDIARSFGVADGNQRQFIISFFLMGGGIGCLLPGFLSDRFGRRPVLLIALLANIVIGLVISFVNNFHALLAMRVVQGLCTASLIVVPTAVVRDLYDGDRMAKLLSLVGAVFITIPVLAPSLGQAILHFVEWRWIFRFLAILSVGAVLWVHFRLPETLDPQSRQSVKLDIIAYNMGAALTKRRSSGYVFGAMLMTGALFGYLNSSQQLISEHMGAGDLFPLIFGLTAMTMMFSNIVNSRIVERFGARRVSHAGILAYIVVSLAQLWAAIYRDGELAWFVPLIALNLGLVGFLTANLGAIAMQPFASSAGSASSAQAFARLLGAALIGMTIGQAYDGTALPLAAALLICSILALLLVLWSEKGKLFRRLNPPRRRHSP
ncbi:MAG: multidrug effflux MFS transporter [Caenibius sp.]